MSMDPNRWLKTLPKMNTTFQTEECIVDANRFVNTLPKVRSNNSVKKYSLPTILIVAGIIFVSAIKNETRNLQKEISNLQLLIDNAKFELHQATLDHEVITSPENISRLAKEYLEFNLISYKQSQIKQLSKETKTKNKTDKLKSHVAKKIEKKKNELKKLQLLYSSPKKIPSEIRLKVARKIKEKKANLKKIISTPKDSINLSKVQRWAGIQLVKAFLGIPIIPGK